MQSPSIQGGVSLKSAQKVHSWKITELGHHPQTLMGTGADDRIRTGDLLITNPILADVDDCGSVLQNECQRNRFT